MAWFGFNFCVLRLRFQLFFFFLRAGFVNFSTVNSASVHCSRTHKHHFSVTFSLKMDLMVLFIHLKIILLQYFQFSVFNFSKISSIQTDSKYQCIFLIIKKKRKKRKKVGMKTFQWTYWTHNDGLCFIETKEPSPARPKMRITTNITRQ